MKLSAPAVTITAIALAAAGATAETLTQDGQGILDGNGERIVIFNAKIDEEGISDDGILGETDANPPIRPIDLSCYDMTTMGGVLSAGDDASGEACATVDPDTGGART